MSASIHRWPLSTRVGLVLLTTLTLGAIAAGAAIPARWVAGRSYTPVVPAQPTSVATGKVEIIEMFWYGSDDCFRLESKLEHWRKQGQPAFVSFERVPIITNSATLAHARLFYTLEALGKLEQLHSVVFRDIHVNSKYFVDADPATSESLQRRFLKANGVSDEEFDRTYSSSSVENRLQRAAELTRRYKATFTDVPLMVVNGAYTADVSTAGGDTELLELVDDLAASERRP